MPPQINAELITISTDGTSEDWDEPAGPAGPAKWQGAAGAYVMENVKTVYSTTAGGMVKINDVQIIIDSTLVGTDDTPLQVNTGDIFTYIFQGVQHSRRAMDIKNPVLPGLGLQEYIVVHLNPSPVEVALENEESQ